MPFPLACSYHQPSNDGLSLGTCEDIFRVMTQVTKIRYRATQVSKLVRCSLEFLEDFNDGFVLNWVFLGLFLGMRILQMKIECGTLFASSAENAMEGDTVTIVSLYMSFLLPLVRWCVGGSTLPHFRNNAFLDSA
ncbi:hypothetical protein E2542_SST04588 [Spatholobus suberectus]|nr:hypothetical protein E2542_SST04588 [Spatholobus suberectus]